MANFQKYFVYFFLTIVIGIYIVLLSGILSSSQSSLNFKLITSILVTGFFAFFLFIVFTIKKRFGILRTGTKGTATIIQSGNFITKKSGDSDGFYGDFILKIKQPGRLEYTVDKTLSLPIYNPAVYKVGSTLPIKINIKNDNEFLVDWVEWRKMNNIKTNSLLG